MSFIGSPWEMPTRTSEKSSRRSPESKLIGIDERL